MRLWVRGRAEKRDLHTCSTTRTSGFCQIFLLGSAFESPSVVRYIRRTERAWREGSMGQDARPRRYTVPSAGRPCWLRCHRRCGTQSGPGAATCKLNVHETKRHCCRLCSYRDGTKKYGLHWDGSDRGSSQRVGFGQRPLIDLWCLTLLLGQPRAKQRIRLPRPLST